MRGRQSWGGWLAQAYVLKYPHKVQGLILADTLNDYPSGIAGMKRWIAQLPKEMAEAIRNGEKDNKFDSPEYKAASEVGRVGSSAQRLMLAARNFIASMCADCSHSLQRSPRALLRWSAIRRCTIRVSASVSAGFNLSLASERAFRVQQLVHSTPLPPSDSLDSHRPPQRRDARPRCGEDPESHPGRAWPVRRAALQPGRDDRHAQGRQVDRSPAVPELVAYAAL
jgi:pimeloyl-ACP methyl ester carboxylesterase